MFIDLTQIGEARPGAGRVRIRDTEAYKERQGVSMKNIMAAYGDITTRNSRKYKEPGGILNPTYRTKRPAKQPKGQIEQADAYEKRMADNLEITKTRKSNPFTAGLAAYLKTQDNISGILTNFMFDGRYWTLKGDYRPLSKTVLSPLKFYLQFRMSQETDPKKVINLKFHLNTAKFLTALNTANKYGMSMHNTYNDAFKTDKALLNQGYRIVEGATSGFGISKYGENTDAGPIIAEKLMTLGLSESQAQTVIENGKRAAVSKKSKWNKRMQSKGWTPDQLSNREENAKKRAAALKGLDWGGTAQGVVNMQKTDAWDDLNIWDGSRAIEGPPPQLIASTVPLQNRTGTTSSSMSIEAPKKKRPNTKGSDTQVYNDYLTTFRNLGTYTKGEVEAMIYDDPNYATEIRRASSDYLKNG